MEVRSPKTSEEFEAYFALRHEVLRKPWGQPEGSERDELENSSIHAACFQDGKVLGGARLQRNDNTTGQIRYMAVKPDHQSKGIGAAMLKHLEEKAKEMGLSRLILQARGEAVEFYKRNGYKVEEKTFLMYDSIQHYLMEKTI